MLLMLFLALLSFFSFAMMVSGEQNEMAFAVFGSVSLVSFVLLSIL